MSKSKSNLSKLHNAFCRSWIKIRSKGREGRNWIIKLFDYVVFFICFFNVCFILFQAELENQLNEVQKRKVETERMVEMLSEVRQQVEVRPIREVLMSCIRTSRNIT